MQKIWTAEHYCPQCQRTFKLDVYSDDLSELPDEEKESVKEHLISDHYYDSHIYCWKCKRHIKVEEIKAMIAVGAEAKPLCVGCVKSSNAS